MVLLQIQKILRRVLGGKANISCYNHLLTRTAPISSSFQMQSLAELAVPIPAEGCCSSHTPACSISASSQDWECCRPQHLTFQRAPLVLETHCANILHLMWVLGLALRYWVVMAEKEPVMGDQLKLVNTLSMPVPGNTNFFESFLCENMRRVIMKANKCIHLELITSHWDTQASH